MRITTTDLITFFFCFDATLAVMLAWRLIT